MPELLHVDAVVQCLHAAPAKRATGNSRVKVSGKELWTISSTLTVTGCPFTITPPGKVQPCVSVDWLTGTVRVKAGGEAVVFRQSSSLCKSAEQIPQGTASPRVSQTRVKGT